MNKYFNTERERIVLSQIIDNEDDQNYYLEQVQDYKFYDRMHQHIIKIAKHLDSQKKIVSFQTIRDYIKLNENEINQTVLLSTLESIIEQEVGGSVEEHLQLIDELYQNRIIDDEIVIKVKKLQDDNKEISEIISHIQDSVSKIVLDTSENVSSTATKVLEAIKNNQTKGEDNLLTSIRHFDKGVGTKMHRYFVWAALSSVGKSAVSYDLMLKYFKNNPAGSIAIKYFSLEIPKEDFMLWLISNITSITFKRLEGGGMPLTPDEIKRVEMATEWISTLNLSIEDGINTIDDVALKTKKFCLENKDKHCLLFLDHHLKVKMKSKDIRQHVIDLSLTLANLAKHNNLSVHLLAQLRRDLLNEKYAESLHRPSADFIQESGSIFQDAHHVICLWRPDMYKYKGDDPNMKLPDIHDMHFIVEKNKNGQKDFDIVVKCQMKYAQLLDKEVPF